MSGEGWEEGGSDERRVPRLKVKIGSDSAGEVKVQPGSSSEVGVKIDGRRLSRSSKTSDTDEESARFVYRINRRGNRFGLIYAVIAVGTIVRSRARERVRERERE